MFDIIKETFPGAEAHFCLKTLTEVEFFIYDTDLKRCAIQDDPAGLKHFTVENPTRREVHFLAIDKCLFFDGDRLQRCDCAVFDSKTFCFVEIKEVDKKAKRSERYQEAKDQLKTTSQYFQERLTFTTKRIEAHACVGRTIARPARQATLYHGNVKRFGP